MDLSIILIIVGTIVIIFGIAIILVAKKINLSANQTIDDMPQSENKEVKKK